LFPFFDLTPDEPERRASYHLRRFSPTSCACAFRTSAEWTNRKRFLGSEERKMNNMSLARIMYGTNQDFHASASMNAVAIPSLARIVVEVAHDEATTQPNILSDLLHKAWFALHRL
jgi:hypothetical protein